MNKCLCCGKDIQEKTKSGKPRKYCNKSCSRKHYCANNKKELSEINKKGYQTLLEKNPELVSSRGKMTEKKRASLRKLEEDGHFKRMNEKSSASNKGVKKTTEQIEKWRKTYTDNGYMLENPKEWKQYNRKCRNLTIRLYGSADEGMVWDHIVPISYGFKEGIAPEKICSKENIRMITPNENRKKWMHLTEQGKIILESWDEAYS